jgi:poly-gamma-glutamate capsule biosynthesis protein CapA/YwtB (metallophosphatase superfamily)
MALVCLWLLAPAPAMPRDRGVTIEDFESGTPDLASYPGQDLAPGNWELTTANAYQGSGSSLRLFGNTWKMQDIDTVAVADTSVWQVAVHCEYLGEMQALGVSDGQNELFYTFFGRDLPLEDNWATVYQGSEDRNQWHSYLLPVGRDWLACFGYLPDLNRLIYVNDADSGTPGVTLFDAIADVSADLPQAPQARILYTVENQTKVSDKLFRLAVQFHGEVFDADSDTHDWAWDFGDSTASSERDPLHQFLVHADYPYTVGLQVTDPEGMAGGDTCQVAVAAGGSDGPLTVNFVGDVFTGRAYEYSGGIIDTHGIEALFRPTLEIFGQAADVNVANLEVSYTDRGTPHPTKSVVFRSQPQNMAGISFAGVDVVTLGNNHIIDYGEIGMLDTIDGLNDLHIGYCGAGSSEYQALLPTFWTEKGVRLGFLGLCNRTGRQWNYQPFLDAGFNKPGFAYLLPDNLESSIDYTAPLSDIVIVQTHSGDEYQTAPPPDGSAGFEGPRPVIEAASDGPGDVEFRFRTEPTPGERELRRLAIDLGADVLINHHPHVLQGFESYQGKLIAHSLGNFIFDLYYTETMPTLVLTLEMTKTGITGYRFTPAWINHWIPEPATGNLGREIVGRLASYSRPMNAVVQPLQDSNEARIYLSRVGLDSTVTATEAAVVLTEMNGRALSAPLKLAGNGSLSGIAEILGSGQWEARWGQELLWLGGFEDEGADLWDVNTEDEELVTDVAHGGQRSLRLRRLSSAFNQTGTDLEKHLPCDPGKEHSAVSWLRAENASQARTMVRFYDTRYSESPVGDFDVADRFDGTTDWVRQWRNLETPSNAAYFEMRCGHEPPASGTGYSWYDDLALIEWEPWTQVAGDLKIPAPGNNRFLQVRGTDPTATEATVVYLETTYGARPISAVTQDTPSAPNLGLRCFPNPANPRVTVELDLTGMGKSGTVGEVNVAVFDLRGHRVRTLHRGPLESGLRHGLTWDGRDDHGQNLASGVYLVQAKAGQKRAGLKVTLVR